MFKLSRAAVRAGRTSRPLTISRTLASQSSTPSTSTSSSDVPAEETQSTTGTALPATKQSPNYPTTWSTSQQSRAAAYQDARFEQTILELQPQPLSAMDLIAQEPVRFVRGRIAECDGGKGPLGHPKIFINLDQPKPKPCGGLRFQQAPHDH
ncbi:hypothetical protein ACEPAI_731 [Sanghuangporus weigelae]